MRRAWLTIMLSLAPVLATGCADPKPLNLTLSDRVERPPRSVVIFFVDGMDETRFNQMLSAGELPHIADRFAHRGVRVDVAAGENLREVRVRRSFFASR